jgi:hypothetical protein
LKEESDWEVWGRYHDEHRLVQTKDLVRYLMTSMTTGTARRVLFKEDQLVFLSSFERHSGWGIGLHMESIDF